MLRRPPFPLRKLASGLAQRWGLALACVLSAGAARADLPDAFASPAVTIPAGLLALLAAVSSLYALNLRQRLTRLEGGAPPRSDRKTQASPHNRFFLQAVEDGHCLESWFAADGQVFWVNRAVERFIGSDVDKVVAQGFVDMLVYERDRVFCRDRIRQALESGVVTEFELRLVDGHGKMQWMSCHWQPIWDGEQRLVGLRGTMNDIQARKEAEYKLLETVAALRRAQALSEHYLRRSNEERSRLSALLDSVRLGILFMDTDQRVVYGNRALYEIWRIEHGESFVGVRDAVLLDYICQQLEDGPAYRRHMADVLKQPEASDTFEMRFKDGRVVTDLSRIVPGPDRSRSLGRIWVFEDITEQRRVAQQLISMAERDPLTNLFNRRRFHEELERMLADGSRHKESVGLLAIDLDGFKPVNDRFGHQAGDEVLINIANAVGSVVRRNEMFFRLGGDEFAILVPATCASEMGELARRVCACVEGLTFQFGGVEVHVTASIGIALSHADDRDSAGERLIGAADRAMYLAKASGGNCWAFDKEPVALAAVS